MRGSYESLRGTCGVHLFNYFRGGIDLVPISQLSLGGAKLGCAGFVNTPECLGAYNELKEKFNIVYQSTPRLNSNSGRKFFFVVYDGNRK